MKTPTLLAAIIVASSLLSACHTPQQHTTSGKGSDYEMKLTGVIVVGTPSGKDSPVNDGFLRVTYADNSSANIPATWQVSQNGVGGPWSSPLAVGAPNTQPDVAKRVRNYHFRIVAPGHTVPLPVPISVEADKVLPITIRFR